MKKSIVIVFTFIFLLSFSGINAQNTYIEIDFDNSVGVYPPNFIAADTDIELHLRYVNETHCSQAPTNAFRIFTADGADWNNFEGVCADPQVCYEEGWPILTYPFPDGNDGPPEDMVGIGGVRVFESWNSPYDDIAVKICFHTGSTVGSHITLDSTSFSGFDWVWAQTSCVSPETPIYIVPGWGGPYEFEIIEPPTCCQGELRGDANCSGGDTDISDVTRLVDYLYLTHAELCCFDEADVNANDDVDITDISCIIQDMYLFNPCIQPCPGTGEEPYVTVDNHTFCKSFTKSADTVVSADDCIEWHYDGSGTLSITRINIGFNCCVDEMGTNVTFENGLITFDEYEINPMCECLCLYDMDLTVHNLQPGTYTLRFLETYTYEYDTILEVTVDLTSEPDGIFCLERLHYPWGY